MKLKLGVFLFIGTIIFAYSQKAENQFAQAADFPRNALVYVQFADFPAAVRRWNESNLKQNYLQSENFKQFENRHLALKLAERFSEFNNTLGFRFGLETFTNVSETHAAIAVYDIGKMEAVFIAPVSEAVFSASTIFQNQTNFEAITLKDETIYYRREIEIDRGRQKQKFAFANVRGRFILASNEKLLLQTISIINGKTAKNRLADEPDFDKLAKKVVPHTATVWINQTKLNEDYYFKHYWLMQNAPELKKFRAGMFDFEIREDKLVERREFLLTENSKQIRASIESKKLNNLRGMISENIPFYQITSIQNQPERAAEILRKMLFERKPQKNKVSDIAYKWQNFDESDFYKSSDDTDYDYLGDKFDEQINESEDGMASKDDENNYAQDVEKIFAQMLAPANPQIALSASNPQILPAPMFAEFRQVLILTLGSPKHLNRQNLENTLAEALKNQITVSNAEAQLKWETKNENGQIRRELNLPMLSRGISYSLQNDKLIVADSAILLNEILFHQNKTLETKADDNFLFDNLTVITLDRRAEAFDKIMQRIPAEQPSSDLLNDFFTKNISSLLDVTAQISRIEIKQNQSAEFLSEEINFILK